MRMWVGICCLALAAALPAAVDAQKCCEPKKAAKKKPARVKYEKLACRLGTEDEHARIAVLLADGRVDSFAYYSKWKPRTCSMDVKRGDAYSKWDDTGNTTVVTLLEDKGAFLIDNSPGRYHFIFRDIDRMRYCGMEGKVNGSLTIFKGKQQCQVAGVMDREDPQPVAAAAPAAVKPEARPEPVKPEAGPEPAIVKPEAGPEPAKSAVVRPEVGPEPARPAAAPAAAVTGSPSNPPAPEAPVPAPAAAGSADAPRPN